MEKFYPNIFQALAIFLCFASLNSNAQVNVWPGDANNNGIVNHIDLLYFGMGYSYQGPPRFQKSVQFQAQNGNNWPQNLPNSENFAFLDCNGNGHISLDDTIAIRLNYNSTHGILSPDTLSAISPSGVPLFIHSEIDSVFNRNKLSLDINLGDSLNSLSAFYGVAFSLNYDTSRIKAGSFSVRIDSNAWIKSSGVLIDQPLLMHFENSNLGKLEIALSKSNLINAAGYGKILVVDCIIEDNLIGKDFQALSLNIEDVLLIDNSLAVQEVKTNSKSVNIIATGMQEIAKADLEIDIYPNPAEHTLYIHIKEKGDFSWRIFDLQGKLYADSKLTGEQRNSIDIAHLSNGIYFIQVKGKESQSTKKFVKTN